jgi:tetratricopeptide (TPR) repeat protein
MLIRLFLFPLFLTATVWACLNTPGTDLNGHDAGSFYGLDAHELRWRADMSSPEKARPVSDKQPTTPAKRLEADALDLIYSGKYAAALLLLQKAEADAPGDYSIAANLGTNLELVGDNAEALRWITEAMRRNPDSHRGTEWVHVLVLKAKLRDAAAHATDSRPPLLEVPERVEPGTPILIDGVTRPADQVREAIFYQLHERLVFVKPKDPYAADLLFALARLNANLVNIESATGILQLAETYGYSDPIHIDALKRDLSRALWKSNLYTFSAWALGLSVFVAGLVYAYRRKWFFLSRAAYDAHLALKNRQ